MAVGVTAIGAGIVCGFLFVENPDPSLIANGFMIVGVGALSLIYGLILEDQERKASSP